MLPKQFVSFCTSAGIRDTNMHAGCCCCCCCGYDILSFIRINPKCITQLSYRSVEKAKTLIMQPKSRYMVQSGTQFPFSIHMHTYIGWIHMPVSGVNSMDPHACIGYWIDGIQCMDGV